MLQSIHSNPVAPAASSIYCRWIRESRNGQGRLVAVWIDRDMRCFETEFPLNSQAEVLSQDALDEPGGVTSIVHTKEFNSIKHRS